MNDCRNCKHGKPNGFTMNGKPGITCDIFDMLEKDYGDKFEDAIRRGDCHGWEAKE